MANPRKITSNRTNARLSTGPKTAKGRSRSAKNALRHGLSLPLCDPNLRQEVTALARQISGADASPEELELAKQIAEAEVELRRIRGVRYDLIHRAVSDPDYESRTNQAKKLTTALRVIRMCSLGEHVAEQDVKFLCSTLSEPERF